MFIYPALDNSILIIQKKLKINNNSGVKCFPAIILKSNKQKKNSNNKKKHYCCDSQIEWKNSYYCSIYLIQSVYFYCRVTRSLIYPNWARNQIIGNSVTLIFVFIWLQVKHRPTLAGISYRLIATRWVTIRWTGI